MRRLQTRSHFHEHLAGGESGVDRLQKAGNLGRSNLARYVPARAIGDRPESEIGSVDIGVLVQPVRRAGMRRGTGAEAAE